MQSDSPILLETMHLWKPYLPSQATFVMGYVIYLHPFAEKAVLKSVYYFSPERMGELLSRSAFLILERIVLTLIDCHFLESQAPVTFSY